MVQQAARTLPENLSAVTSVAGVEVVFDCTGALWLPEESILVFSDLHFEKGSSYGSKGLFLPPYDTRRTLATVAEVISRYQPQTVISLGDAFHDRQAEARMDKADAAMLEELTRAFSWVWILGNHDPVPPARFRGRACEQITLSGLVFTHEPHTDGRPWHVAGHLHPCARVSRSGRSVRRRCFVTNGERLILPAFGANTGGLNVLDAAYQPVFPEKFDAFLLGQDQVWQVPRRELRPDGVTSTYRQ